MRTQRIDVNQPGSKAISHLLSLARTITPFRATARGREILTALLNFLVAEDGGLSNVSSMNQLDLARQCAVVTDGARGIGLAISRRLLQSGASGCIWDCDVRALDEATGIFAPFGKVHAVEMDVTSEPSVLASVEATVGHLGFISLLMNNAGIAGNNARTWKLDVTGVFLCCRAVVPLEDSDAPVRQGR